MALLESVQKPVDLKELSREELAQLAREIRAFLIREVSRTGGHLGPNLGMVELTIALHRVFESPRDCVLFDTGHQAYTHKLLTGRQDFSRLKGRRGLSGYPSRAESEHDMIENSHASTVLSWAEGLAKAHRLSGRGNRHVVAVIGDGALTGGLAWEALNNIAMAEDEPLIIVINDNERSYAPTVGGLAHHLAALRVSKRYERVLQRGGKTLTHRLMGDTFVYRTLHDVKRRLQFCIAPRCIFFETLGLKYLGPIDGHDEDAVETALRQASMFDGPIVVHCITQKGRGYPPAELDEVDHFHCIPRIDPDTGLPVTQSGADWTGVFREEMIRIGDRREDVVAITAAMLQPVGLDKFAAAYPDRIYDVGIAEQHATVLAAGLASGGLHPVVAVYATFLNRAFDQVLMDAALHRLGITFVLDRAGVTGPDGASHNGMWDLSVFQVVPGLQIAAPRDGEQLRAELHEAIAVNDGPTMIRYPKGTVGHPMPAVGRIGGVDILRRAQQDPLSSGESADVLLVSVGALAPMCLEIAKLLNIEGVSTTVVDPRWVKPIDSALLALASTHRIVATVEDNVRIGGVGAAIAQALQDEAVDVPVRNFGIPQRFLSHSSREEILTDIGLTSQAIVRDLIEFIARFPVGPKQKASDSDRTLT